MIMTTSKIDIVRLINRLMNWLDSLYTCNTPTYHTIMTLQLITLYILYTKFNYAWIESMTDD